MEREIDFLKLTKPQMAIWGLLRGVNFLEDFHKGMFREVALLMINFVLPLKTASEKAGDYGLDCHGVERLDSKSMAEIAILRNLGLITSQVAKEVVEKLWQEWSGRDVAQILIQDKLLDFSNKEDGPDLSSVVASVLEEQTQAVSDYKGGKPSAFGRLMGAAMKKLGRGADPKEVKAELERQLA